MKSPPGLAAFLLLAAVSICAGENYCFTDSCRSKGEHTMCKYESPKPAASCGPAVASYGVSEKTKQAILKKHNELRAYVAAGLEKRGHPGPQPPSKHMPPLVWDDELATVAQRWVNQCQRGHDRCRNVDRFRVGQNAGMKMASNTYLDKAEDIVQAWYNEVDLFDAGTTCKHKNFDKVGHYTQVVWEGTTKVGCGEIKYKNGKWHVYQLVCNYGPAGNIIDQDLYSAPSC